VSPIGGSVIVCPAGDTPSLASQGVTITLAFTSQGQPAAGIPAQDIKGTDNCGTLQLCVRPQADHDTDAAGETTYTGVIKGGGYATEMFWLNGFIPEADCIVLAAPLVVRSPDINGNLAVDLVDVAFFAQGYPPNPFDDRVDFDGSGTISLVDLALFAGHWLHTCQ
jgi:hypothetical protein